MNNQEIDRKRAKFYLEFDMSHRALFIEDSLEYHRQAFVYVEQRTLEEELNKRILQPRSQNVTLDREA